MKLQNFPIIDTKISLSKKTRTSLKDAYASVYLTGFGTLALLLFSLPHSAGAFWPIPFLQAGTGGLSQPVLHDETIPLLRAAMHSDPNPNKGDFEIALSDDTALVAQSGAIGGMTEVIEAPRAGQVAVYVVREGDTLSEIAALFDVSSNTILWANDIKKASVIAPGTKLIILPVTGVKHTVRKGDTLKSLAKKYGADADDIASYNGLESAEVLALGAEVIIPGGELAAPASAPKIAGAAPRLAPTLPSTGLFSNPVPGSRVTQGIHGYNGVDLGAPYGTPIYSAAGGSVIVSRSGGYNGGYGSYVVIDHGNGAQTLYAHMSTVVAVAGTSVDKGELIGYVGSTGRSTGNHVHFEVRGGYRNPFAY